ncbi:hypothetical protein DID80_00115 [Candidatus Marinamargulisbacteria bacterium SCGC AAA071-K20]|nr:hypothetical protein DID80_00115 [Candidatus Marinamargulisbacteria bacterium SCGC AAA071-K20]
MMTIYYRELKGYKYQLLEDFQRDIPIQPNEDINTHFIKLTKLGQLTIIKGYAWDGPSGPTIDTKNFMTAALVHDSLYQLMRQSQLDYIIQRPLADQLLKDMCKESGMSGFRAWYVHKALNYFGEKNAKPLSEGANKRLSAP